MVRLKLKTVLSSCERWRRASIGVEHTWAAVWHRWDYPRNFSLLQRCPCTLYPFACSPPSFTDGLCLVLKRTVFGLSRTTAHLLSHNHRYLSKGIGNGSMNIISHVQSMLRLQLKIHIVRSSCFMDYR